MVRTSVLAYAMPEKKVEPASKTTTVAFDADTLRALKLLAVERDTNVRELVREAVAEYLKRHRGRKS